MGMWLHCCAIPVNATSFDAYFGVQATEPLCDSEEQIQRRAFGAEATEQR